MTNNIPNSCPECPHYYRCDTGIHFPDCPYYRPMPESPVGRIKKFFMKIFKR